MQHYITILLGQIARTQPGGVLGHCPVDKQMIGHSIWFRLSGTITTEGCGCHAGQQCLEF